MSTKRIRWIVLSMAIGLLGLVGFQLYWINTALHLQQEQFDYKVTDALQAVVRSLERQESQYKIRQQLHMQQQQQQLMAIGRNRPQTNAPSARPAVPVPSEQRVAANQTLPRQRTRSAANQGKAAQPGVSAPGAVVVQSDVLHPHTQQLTLEQAQVVKEFFRQQDELMATGDWQAQLVQQQRFEHWISQIAANPLSQLHEGSELVLVMPESTATHKPNARPQQRRVAQRVRSQGRTQAPVNRQQLIPDNAVTAVSSATPANQSQMIKDVLKGLLMSDRPLEERVNRFTLDTLLRQALQERGITIPFEYAVRSNGQATYLFASMTANQAALNQRFTNGGYKAALFPNNILETGNYLYLFFPDQRSYILERMTATLAGSALLILVIMGCFYVAISTILRQKKMADIKNDFINNMTHEFKTPISTISLAVDMARDQLRQAQQATLVGAEVSAPGTLTERLGRYMGIIRDENQRLGSHVEKVLQMALLDKGEVKLKLAPVNVHDVVEKVLNSMSLAIEQRQGEVELEFEATDEIVQADEVHLTNMLYNLLDNAIKYSPERVAIRVRTHNTTLISPKTGTPRPAVAIAVADQGLGLTKEQQSRIFDTFYRVPTGNRHDVKGFGLGLSYVKKMAEEHHGQVTISSVPGQGSEFEIVIPLMMSDD